MDIRNNLSTANHFSPYNASAYGGGAAGAEGGQVHSPTSPPRFPSGGDSLMALGGSSYSDRREKRVRTPEELMARWLTICQICVGISVVTALCFAFLVIQPFLVVLFTLGDCVAGGCDDWLEFAHEVFLVSLIPLAITLLMGIFSSLAYLRVERLRQSASSR